MQEIAGQSAFNQAIQNLNPEQQKCEIGTLPAEINNKLNMQFQDMEAIITRLEQIWEENELILDDKLMKLD